MMHRFKVKFTGYDRRYPDTHIILDIAEIEREHMNTPEDAEEVAEKLKSDRGFSRVVIESWVMTD